jgi:anti-sigma B factor antagonist
VTQTDSAEPRLERAPDPADGVALVVLGGELDLAVSGRLRALVDEVVAEGPRLVVADVTEVGFMDSTVLREMLRAHREVDGGGGRLIVAGAQPTVRRLFELTGTVDLFALADSRDEALASA